MRQKPYKLDPHTLGGTKASETLAKILNEQFPQCIAKTSAFYHKFTAHLASCVRSSKCFSDGGLATMVQLYKEHKFKVVRNSNLPEIVKSYLLNVMSVSYYQTLLKIKNTKR